MSSGLVEVVADVDGVVGHEPVDLSGDSTFEASFDLARCFAFGGPAGGVGLGGFMDPKPGQGHGVQGAVELAITGVVEPVPGDRSAASGDGCSTAKRCERGFGPDSARVRPGHQELCSGDGAYTGLVEQYRTNSKDELFEFGLVLGRLCFQSKGTAGSAADCSDRRAVFDRLGGRRAKVESIGLVYDRSGDRVATT